jgi:RNA polymerase sigma-70 factor (ECF subfamily)
MEREGKTALFAQLRPFLTAEPDAVGLRSIAEALGSTEGAVRVAAHRLRQAWRDSIRAEVASTIDDVRDLDDEVRGLFAALGG